MKKTLGTAALLLCGLPWVAMAQFTPHFQQIISAKALMPGYKASHFSNFERPYLYNGKVVFVGLGQDAASGVYQYADGHLQMIADTRTVIPGQKHRHFSRFTALMGRVFETAAASPVDQSVIFTGGAGVYSGVFMGRDSQHLQVIADTHMMMAKGVKFGRFFDPYFVGHNTAAFVGIAAGAMPSHEAIYYKPLNGKLTAGYGVQTQYAKVRFINMINPAFGRRPADENTVAVNTSVGSPANAIYVSRTAMRQGPLTLVAKAGMPVPGRAAQFDAVRAISMDGPQAVTFHGFYAHGQNGYYTYDGHALKKVVDLNTAVPGYPHRHFVDFFNQTVLHDPKTQQDDVAFHAFTRDEHNRDLEDGIYLYYHGKLRTLIASNQRLQGHRIRRPMSISFNSPLELGSVSLAFDPKQPGREQVAFEVMFNSGRRALYLATL